MAGRMSRMAKQKLLATIGREGFPLPGRNIGDSGAPSSYPKNCRLSPHTAG